METIDGKDRGSLRTIAHRVMLERGLLPDFSAAACGEAEAMSGACVDASPASIIEVIGNAYDVDHGAILLRRGSVPRLSTKC